MAEQDPRARAHKRSATGFIQDGDVKLSEIFPGNPETWKSSLSHLAESEKIPADSIVRHTALTLARASYNVDTLAMYQATSLSVRDRLIKSWNETQLFHTQAKPKRVYYFSLEFLMGKALDNALINLSVKEDYEASVKALGFPMEDLLDTERDAGLGNGGLGRLAACYMDSLTTLNIPAWGYGLRYKYGIFRQLIDASGAQIEAPDPWLVNDNPWELLRSDNTVEVFFAGHAEKVEGGLSGTWTPGYTVLAVPYDMPIPGFGTRNTNNIRLWASKPKTEFDFGAFNAGEYESSVRAADEAENITRVLYPNENFPKGKELRLKQQYFWVSASLRDIVRRFKKITQDWAQFPDYTAIQLNDTHPTIAIVELMRVLIDEEGVAWDDAWDIVRRTFGYTNHTVMPEALEKWPVPLLQALLPRLMQIIFDINMFWLQAVEARFPNDRGRLARMSLIEEGYPQHVRMAYLAVIGSHKVNGVAELHSMLVRDMFADFVDFFGPDHFGNVTNGITARRWLLQCNPALSDLIYKTLGADSTWPVHLDELKKLVPYAKDAAFQSSWAAIKHQNKTRLAEWVETHLGITLNPAALFDVQCKRIHEYKRQFMNVLGVIYRYVQLKKMSPAERALVVPRVSIFAGKAAPGYYIAKLVIQLINAVSQTINSDSEFDSDVLNVVFLPDYSVSLAEIIIPASDISEHISTAGTEASGTSNMKFCLNGGLLLGTRDGANIEIAEQVGEENVFFFGNLTEDVENLRQKHSYAPYDYPSELLEAVDAIRAGVFGEAHVFEPLLSTLFEGRDHYLISDDFLPYLAAQRAIDEAYLDQPSWIAKTVYTTARMGMFASDRAVAQYAEEIWSVEPLKVPDQL